MNKLQIHELNFCLNSRVHPNETGSPIAIARFFGGDVRETGLPNSFNRDIKWETLMENKRKNHQNRVNKKRRTRKESYQIGERVQIQNVVSKLWNREAKVKGIDTAADERIVSYPLDLNGAETTRHRKFLRKIASPPDSPNRASPAASTMELVSERSEPALRRLTRLQPSGKGN